MSTATNYNPEIWGGIECTINRINDQYFDQLEYAGFYSRHTDIDKLAELGIKALRYPILWEKYQSDKRSSCVFRRAQQDLQKLNDYKITPIVGLVHHGSGPSFVNFFDGSFENGLAQYAKHIIREFPHLKYFTPVNEPLTTARFCGAYGHWYPHKKDNSSFCKILISECKAIVLSMRAICNVTPQAQLIQTEDLGKTHSIASLQYQADFENERRWMAIDLLCGKIVPGHAMWAYLIDSGVDEADLFFFIQNKYAPDVLGLNYYITSERFIDTDLEQYPEHTHGTNFKHNYADVEAIRVGKKAYFGPKTLLKEAWEKYKIPIVITEVHLNCHREEQVRWFNYIWQTAKELNAENVNIKAVTAWALLGSFGWSKLLTEGDTTYEPGAFDVRSGELRPLALARVLKSIADNIIECHPAYQGSGWWQRNIRFLYHRPAAESRVELVHQNHNTQPVLILGKTGTLGKAFARICEARNIIYKILSRAEVDICKPQTIKKAINDFNPWAIINATGYVKVDEAEHNFDECLLSNTIGTAYLANYCRQYEIQLLTFSSDLVFDGKKRSPYTESDQVAPLNMYGRSKAFAEHDVLTANKEAIIIRTSAFFGPWDEYNFVSSAIYNLSNNKVFIAADNVVVSPTYIPDLANISLDLLIDKASGVWHVANEGEVTWSHLAKIIAQRLNLNSSLIHEKPLNKMPFVAKRPLYSVLKSERGMKLPTFFDALDRYISEANIIERFSNTYIEPEMSF